MQCIGNLSWACFFSGWVCKFVEFDPVHHCLGLELVGRREKPTFSSKSLLTPPHRMSTYKDVTIDPAFGILVASSDSKKLHPT